MKRQKSEIHLTFIRTLPCVVCNNNTSVEAAHIRFSCLRAGKRQTGMGEKPDDSWTLPLCGIHHREQHTMGEQDFWKKHGLDPIFLALALYRAPDHQTGVQIVLSARD